MLIELLLALAAGAGEDEDEPTVEDLKAQLEAANKRHADATKKINEMGIENNRLKDEVASLAQKKEDTSKGTKDGSDDKDTEPAPPTSAEKAHIEEKWKALDEKQKSALLSEANGATLREKMQHIRGLWLDRVRQEGVVIPDSLFDEDGSADETSARKDANTELKQLFDRLYTTGKSKPGGSARDTDGGSRHVQIPDEIRVKPGDRTQVGILDRTGFAK